MALNASGPISLAGAVTGESIALELGQSATGEISLNQGSVRTLAGKSTGAVVMPTDFWGKSNELTIVFSLTQTVTGNYSNIYQFTVAGGFGTRYSQYPIPSGSTAVRGVATDNFSYVAFISQGTIIRYSYSFSYAGGFGTQISYVSESLLGVVMCPNATSTAIAQRGSSSPYLQAWRYTGPTGWGTAYSGPASPNWSNPPYQSVIYCPSNNRIFGPSDTATGVYEWSWNDSSGFGTRTQPLSGMNYQNFTWNPSLTYLVTHSASTSPYVRGFNYSASTGIGTQLSNPSTLPLGSRYGGGFNRAGNVVATAGIYTAGFPIVFYQWSSGFGTAYSIGLGNIGQVRQANWNKTDTAVMVTSATSPYVLAYAWSNSTGLGTKYADPAVIPTASSNNNFGKFNND